MIEIYTCITAGYDDLKKQPVARDVRYTAFVEGVTLPRPPWARLPVPTEDRDPTRRARQMKVLAHRSLPKAEYSLWVDGCFRIEADFFTHGLPRWLGFLRDGDADLLTFKHTEHDCTYVHAARIVDVGTDAPRVVHAQMQRYREAGLPEHAGMVQTNVLLRRHTEPVQLFNERWWQEIQAGSRRDQLSFVWAARAEGLRYLALPVEERRFFKGMSHRGSRMVVT